MAPSIIGAPKRAHVRPDRDFRQPPAAQAPTLKVESHVGADAVVGPRSQLVGAEMRAIVASKETCAPAQLFVYFSSSLQSLYARRGMWINNAPQGALAGMLGPHKPLLSNDQRKAFHVAPDQLAALWRDACAIPIEVIGLRGRGQIQRRLKEAAQRGGFDMRQLLSAESGSQPALAVAPDVPMPFHPLHRPTAGKAKVLFQDHVWRTLRDFVDYTQGSEYLDGASS